MGLATGKTLDNLKAAMVLESQASRRYRSLAERLELQGRGGLTAVFRTAAAGEAGHAQGHLALMEEIDGLEDIDRLQALLVGRTSEAADRYSGMARTARDEGFEDVADWFETLARAETARAGRFRRALGRLD